MCGGWCHLRFCTRAQVPFLWRSAASGSLCWRLRATMKPSLVCCMWPGGQVSVCLFGWWVGGSSCSAACIEIACADGSLSARAGMARILIRRRAKKDVDADYYTQTKELAREFLTRAAAIWPADRQVSQLKALLPPSASNT